jgi:DNA polymerase elongation subunit (family B)
LGLPAFRFYDVDNAEAVTTTGQTVIKSTADMANIKYNKELGTTGQDFNIYIDTDSVFFSAVPILDHRYKDWRSLTDAEIALKVDAIAGETQDC